MTIANILEADPEPMVVRLRNAIPDQHVDNDEPLALIATALTTLRSRAIVSTIYGEVPDGLIGALARVGSDPLRQPVAYRMLFDLFARPQYRARAKVLRQISGSIGQDRIEIVRSIDPIFLCATLIGSMHDPKQVETLQRAVALIRAVCSTATDEALAESVEQLRPGADIGSWVKRWLGRMDRLPVRSPIPSDDRELIPVYGADLIALGRQMGNCAAGRVPHVAVGKNLYFKWRGAPIDIVVELRALSHGRWIVADILGPRNRRPDPDILAPIRKRLHDYGVLSYGPALPGGSLSGLGRMIGVYGLAGGDFLHFLEDDEEEDEPADEAA